MERLISGFGIVVLIGIAWLLGSDRRRVPWRVIGGGIALQFGLALLVLKTGPGQAAFRSVGAFFQATLSYVDVGAEFVFGPSFEDVFIAFKVLPVIVCFSALMAILYHWGIAQRMVAAFGWLMRRTLRTSGAESLAAAANVFVGMTEAPLVVRPYMAGMTRSELMSLMVGGFATIAGSVFAAYVGMGVDAGHLLTASVISAPAALLVAKVMVPETEQPETLGAAALEVGRDTTNVLDAITRGTSTGLRLAVNVGAMLLVFVALIAMVDGGLSWVGERFGAEEGAWSLEAAAGVVFAPVAWVLGVPWDDCRDVGALLGIKTVANEFIAYQRMGEWAAAEGEPRLAERSSVIATYALCGFANFGSIGIQLGGLGALVPERRGELAQLALRAMVGGLLAGFMTAAVAGVLL